MLWEIRIFSAELLRTSKLFRAGEFRLALGYGKYKKFPFEITPFEQQIGTSGHLSRKVHELSEFLSY